MWKKDETPTAATGPEATRTPPPPPPPASPAPAPASAPASRPAGSSQRAAIGQSIRIRGDVTGDEDLLIQGRVEGSVDLRNHVVTVGAEGEVKASITARVVVVEGVVEGNVSSEEQVVLRASARVKGDITAPRVVLEDGARFRGGVDMGAFPEEDEASTGPRASKDTRSEQKRQSAASSSSSSSSGADADKGSGSSARTSEATEPSESKKKGSPELFAEARA